MTASASDRTLDELTLGSEFSLPDLVDRGALGEMARSFHELFGVPLRIFTEEGALLADASGEIALYAYLEGSSKGRHEVQKLINSLKAVDPGDAGEVSLTCFTGATYRVVAITYDSRRIGRMILGPFLSPTLRELPSSLTDVDASLNHQELKKLLEQMPRAREETVAQIARHLKSALDLILFSGHKALLTSSMHLASVKESFRDLKAKNDELQEAYNRLKELDRLKSNFLATVSHELRTPLTSIIGYSEMLKEGIAGEISPEQKEFVQTIHDKGEQLLELIKGLLDLSKLESGTMSLRKSDVQVPQLIEDVAQTLQPAARKKGVKLEHSFDAVPSLWADPDRLRQVLLNLAENALKFTPPDGTVSLSCDSVMMEVEHDEAEGLVLLSNQRPAVAMRVADSGIGIPDGEKERVFDAFYQVDSSSTREAGGTGLGLSIVKRLVDAHDGRVAVEDNDPTGAAFVVTIPCRRATLV